MSKIVVLNSGGFDSVVLMNFLHTLEGEREIFSLHFIYGARNAKQQEACVDKVCEKCGAVNTKINLPPFSWTKNNFYEDNWEYETQYLEYRNLIFLSYALSYAQSIGADRIYLATLKSGNYPDTSEVFFKGLNSFSVPLTNIEIITPFSHIEDKSEMLQYAILTGVKVGDYFSCDTPLENGERCGECLDCKSLDVVDEYLSLNHPFKALYQSDWNYEDKTFIKQLRVIPNNREVRALINNMCQLRCEHCFYGFDEMAEKQVDRETYYETLKDLVLKHGFTSIHFSGKEPLMGDDILYYARRIHEDNLPCQFHAVTNGIEVPNKISALKEYGIEKIFLSVDELFGDNGVRHVSNIADKAINSCNAVGVPVEVFIDLHHGNYNHVGEIISSLYHKGVKLFYVRTIRSIGNAVCQDKLTGEQLYNALQSISQCTEELKDVDVIYSISSEYISEVMQCHQLEQIILNLDSCYSVAYSPQITLELERYCNRYHDITLTPDGYVLGCASEVSRPDYNRISAGNIKRDSIDNILLRGLELRCMCAGCFSDDNYSCVANKL